MKRFDNLIAVLVCDTEGATIAKVINEQKGESLLQCNFLLQNLISCSENVAKLELGECKKIACQYDEFQMVTFYKDKLVVTLIANNQIETGTLMSLEGEFKAICDAVLSEIKNII